MGHKNEDNRSWHAVDTVTGEMCPHHHHTDTSALRCGRAAFGPDRAKAVKAAEPIANPLPVAAVVFPSASSASVR